MGRHNTLQRITAFTVLFAFAAVVVYSAPTVPSAFQSDAGNGTITTDLDGYFSGVSGNDNLTVEVNVTDSDSGANISYVTFNLTNFCAGIVENGSRSNDTFTASCTVDQSVNRGNFNATHLNFTAYTNNSDSTQFNLTAHLYNYTYPDLTAPGNQSGQFEWDTAQMTNLNTVNNLSNTNYVLAPRFNGTGKDYIPWEGMRTGGVMNFSSLDFTNKTVQNNFTQSFMSAISLQFVPHGQFQVGRNYSYWNGTHNLTGWNNITSNRIFVNSSAIGVLDSPANITLNWLPLYSFNSSYIQKDNPDANVTVFNASSANGHTNVTFQVSGFSGYNISDTQDPVITVNDPTNNTYYNDDLLNFTFNGTGTEINNETTNLTVWNTSNRVMDMFNHSELSCSGPSEIVDCTKDLGLATDGSADGQYNYSVTIGDYGNNSGNNITQWYNFTLDTVTPNASIGLNLTTANYTSLQNSTLAENLLNGSAVGLTWNNTTVGDDAAGIDRFEIWAKNRTFNRSAQNFTAWSQNYYNLSVDGALVRDADSTVLSLTEGVKYRFQIRTYDTAGNSNATTPGLNVTIDAAGPHFSQYADGDAIRSPFNWSTEAKPTITANITDLYGIQNDSVNVSIANSSWTHYPLVDVAPTGNLTEHEVTGTYNHSAGLVENKTYTVTLNSTDVFGKTSSLAWNFTVDTTAPTTNYKNFSTTDYNDWHKDTFDLQITCGDAKSGIKDAAVYDGNEAQLDWNSTFNNSKINTTLTKDGDITYTISCRDHAGNTGNKSQRVKIDSADPTITNIELNGESDSNDWDNLPKSFEVTADLSDNGVGINDSVTRSFVFDLSPSDASYSNFDIDGNDVSVDISSLENSEDYNFDITVTDWVGHDATESADFETKSSSTTNNNNNNDDGATTTGSGSGTVDVEFSSLADVDVFAGESVDHDIELDNVGDSDVEDAELSCDIEGDISCSIGDDTFDLTAGDQRDVTLTIRPNTGVDVGDYTASMQLNTSYGTKIVSDTFTVTVPSPKPDLAWEDIPEDITFGLGNSTSASAFITNTGGSTASGVTVSYVVEGLAGATVRVVPNEPVDVAVNESKKVLLSIVNEDSYEVGEYKSTLTFNHSSGSARVTIPVRIEPASDAEKEDLSNDIEALEVYFNSSKDDLNESSQQEVSKMLQDARTALQEENYARAASLKNELSETLAYDPDSGGGIPLWAIAIVVILGLVVAGGYLILPEGSPYPALEGQQTTIQEYEYQSEDESLTVPQDLDELRKSIDAAHSNIRTNLQALSNQAQGVDAQDVREQAMALPALLRWQVRDVTDRIRSMLENLFGSVNNAEGPQTSLDGSGDDTGGSDPEKHSIRFEEDL